MFAAVLFITEIYTALGFNIYTEPVGNFKNDDPLFGQTIIQSQDGLYVPSPTSGDVFRCKENICSRMYISDLTKGLTPIASVASRLKEDEEHFLVCNQVRTRNSSTEYFNGNCTFIFDDQEKRKIYPVKLVLELQNPNPNNNNNNNNKNNNRYQASRMSQDKSRKRRAEENDTIADDDEEDEDAGTEIAFVLDGSGSIEPDDFVRAKDFISNVMKNVWTTCFICNFAIVQFGRDIRTELSLQENDDSNYALDKVKNIEQLGAVTKTASALYHVLTDIFVPQNGSIRNAKKMIILLSDGEMVGDTRNLSDVLNMPQMNGITRYAIGVGKDVINKSKAINEMIEIAGSSERFFKVSNYAALEKILSSLENSIIAIEGLQKGAGFEFQLAEAGFSSHITRDGSILFGAVGAYDWSGGIILTKNNKEPVTFFNASKEEPRFSYLGYSVTSANTDSETLYISGAPRYNLTGAVFIFNENNQDILQGDQVGSYFGSVLCVVDISHTDYLLVGAPHFHVKGEEGKVLIYKLNKGKFEKEASELRGLENYIRARFGSAIADIGDIDGNKIRDVAVGAPLEENDVGCVYIFNGFKHGINNQYSQRITPSDFSFKLVHFGQAVSVIPSAENEQPVISVGSEGVITFFKTIPVIIIKPAIKVDHGIIPLDKQNTGDSSKFILKLVICFNTPRGDIKSGELPIEYNVDLDSGKEQKRLVYIKPQEGKMRFNLKDTQTCIQERHLSYLGCSDCYSPIKIRVNFTLIPSSTIPIRVLDAFSPTEATEEIVFERECRDQQCKAEISLNTSELSHDIVVIGSSQTLDIKFELVNSGDNSYMTTLTLTYPEMLSFKKSEGGTCEGKNDIHQIVCKLLHPIFRQNEQTTVTISWQPINGTTNGTASIIAHLTGGNNGSQELDYKTYSFTVKKALEVQLIGTVMPNRLNITDEEESSTQLLYFNFKLQGQNTYNASITVTITIENHTSKSQIIIKSTQPKSCDWPSDGNIKKTYKIVCNMTKLDEINITAETQIRDIQGQSERISAKGQITFDENIYDGTNIRTRHQADVLLVKLIVVKSTALIVGSSIGGFVLLIFIIIILFKCGFFRRRHKIDRKQSTN
ncbi:integrin alpha-E isoform X2 [Tachysurus fulvidraco]|uniref:integrin alpha-E isoform X2 n=1 Tax=Tachysurus fulvidraco TaxID=1234273 RepID=UPI001FED97C2|nr:integrin alpha-E isoform X2 [Tachysurus fulvidraco]